MKPRRLSPRQYAVLKTVIGDGTVSLKTLRSIHQGTIGSMFNYPALLWVDGHQRVRSTKIGWEAYSSYSTKSLPVKKTEDELSERVLKLIARQVWKKVSNL